MSEQLWDSSANSAPVFKISVIKNGEVIDEQEFDGNVVLSDAISAITGRNEIRKFSVNRVINSVEETINPSTASQPIRNFGNIRIYPKSSGA